MESRVQPTVTGHWNRGLQEATSPELFALAEQVENLQAQPGFAAVMDFVAKGRANVLESLINGPTRSQADYARQMGYVAGMGELPNAVEAIRKAAEQRRAKLEARGEAERTAAAEEES
jgi:hypothetical protein